MPRIKQGGAKVMCFAPALVARQKLVRSGADAIVIEGMEAGGHIGPVSTSVLAQEILPAIRERAGLRRRRHRPRRGDRSAISRWALSGCQLGTRFVCATESIAHPQFKQAFIRASARDAVPSVQLDPRFPVIPVRALVNDGDRALHRVPAQVDRPRSIAARSIRRRRSSRSSISGPARCAAP